MSSERAKAAHGAAFLRCTAVDCGLVRRARSVADGGEAGLIARNHGAGAAGTDADEWTAVRMGTALVGEARPRAALAFGVLERRQCARGRHGSEQEA